LFGDRFVGVAGARALQRMQGSIRDARPSQQVGERALAFERLTEDALARAGAGSSDPRLALSALLGMVNHTAQWYRPRGRLSASAIADGYVDLLSH